MTTKFWTHECGNSGTTQTLHGEPCKWCNITEEDMKDKALIERHDILTDPLDEEKEGSWYEGGNPHKDDNTFDPEVDD